MATKRGVRLVGRLPSAAIGRPARACSRNDVTHYGTPGGGRAFRSLRRFLRNRWKRGRRSAIDVHLIFGGFVFVPFFFSLSRLVFRVNTDSSTDVQLAKRIDPLLLPTFNIAVNDDVVFFSFAGHGHFYRILPSFRGFYQVLPSWSSFYRV